MTEYYASHPQYIFLVAALAILTLFVCIKAGKASARHSRANNEIIKKLKEENALRNEFSVLTESLIESSEPEKLFKGLGLCLQKQVGDSSDMNAAFDALTKGEKYIYSLYCLTEDSSEKLSGFFRMNSSPVTDFAKEAVNEFFPAEFAGLFNSEFDVFDDNNEEASFIPEQIELTDKKAAPFFEDGTAENICGKFIKENVSEFVR